MGPSLAPWFLVSHNKASDWLLVRLEFSSLTCKLRLLLLVFPPPADETRQHERLHTHKDTHTHTVTLSNAVLHTYESGSTARSWTFTVWRHGARRQHKTRRGIVLPCAWEGGGPENCSESIPLQESILTHPACILSQSTVATAVWMSAEQRKKQEEGRRYLWSYLLLSVVRATQGWYSCCLPCSGGTLSKVSANIQISLASTSLGASLWDCSPGALKRRRRCGWKPFRHYHTSL